MILPIRHPILHPSTTISFSVAPYATRKIPTSPQFTIIPTDTHLVYHLIAETAGLLIVSNTPYPSVELALDGVEKFIKSVLASIP